MRPAPARSPGKVSVATLSIYQLVLRPPVGACRPALEPHPGKGMTTVNNQIFNFSVLTLFQKLPRVMPVTGGGLVSACARGAGRLINQINNKPIKQPIKQPTNNGPEPRGLRPDRVHVRYGLPARGGLRPPKQRRHTHTHYHTVVLTAIRNHSGSRLHSVGVERRLY